ncbi:MAG: ABC transporter permease [SAR324 cluster bacterium]|nr:ABC transporter permease [SAR324 cluster bacterium]
MIQRILPVLKKNIIQQWRDLPVLLLTLLTTPLFVLVYWLMFGHAVFTYHIQYTLEHKDGQSSSSIPDTLLNKLQTASTTWNTASFEINQAVNQQVMESQIRQGNITLGIVFPENMFNSSSQNKISEPVLLLGDVSDPVFHMVSAGIQQMLTGFLLEQALGTSMNLVQIQPIMGVSLRSSFEMYVPGLLVFSVIMLIFSAAMTLMRERERGLLERLRLTRVSMIELALGMSIVQLGLGTLSSAMAFITAYILGFESTGSLLSAWFFVIPALLSSIGLGIIAASFSRNMLECFLVSSVLMFVLMLFSGLVFPVPDMVLFKLQSHDILLVDFLPTTHLRQALHKILNLGMPLESLYPEMIGLLLLSIFLFGAGILIFKKHSQEFHG